MKHFPKGFRRSPTPLGCPNRRNCTCRVCAILSFFALCSIATQADQIWNDSGNVNQGIKRRRWYSATHRWCFVSLDSRLSTTGTLVFPFLKNVFLNFCKTLPEVAAKKVDLKSRKIWLNFQTHHSDAVLGRSTHDSEDFRLVQVLWSNLAMCWMGLPREFRSETDWKQLAFATAVNR